MKTSRTLKNLLYAERDRLSTWVFDEKPRNQLLWNIKEIGAMVGEDRHMCTVEERVSFTTSFDELAAFVVAVHEEGVDTKLGRASNRLQARQYLLQLVTYLRTLPVVPGELAHG